jgi:BirA family biotin operon repressor/biotin-[acetyl-CoA-carboxylase] ligase
VSATTYDGLTEGELRTQLGLPALRLRDTVPSTMDLAHEAAAEGAPAGTLVLASVQTAGRGRGGRPWRSDPGGGVTCTLIERLSDTDALSVVSLRIGLALADALQPFSAEELMVKWPNDLMRGGRKLGGVLSEARWRDGHPEWVAIGVGVNLDAPADVPNAAGLGAAASRIRVLQAMVPAMRAACALTGFLSEPELAQFRQRDWSWGRRVEEPERGIARGITERGALVVETPFGARLATAGSLVLTEDGHAAGS